MNKVIEEKTARLDELVLEYKVQAGRVLSDLRMLIQLWGGVTVADLNTLVGWEIHYTDRKFGWMDLSEVEIKKVAGGYRMVFPPLIPLRYEEGS